MFAAVVLVAASCGSDTKTTPATQAPAASNPPSTATPAPTSDVKIGVVYDIGGKGDQSFNDAAYAGLQKAQKELGVKGQDLEPDKGGENREQLVRQLAEGGSNLVIGVGFLFDKAITAAAKDNPKTHFAIVDTTVDAPNVASLTFAEEQGSYLVGAIAALQSKTGKVGFIGGVETDLIKKFEAGFVAGAKKIKADIGIQIKYISQPPDFTGFNDPAKAKEIALSMYGGGADVVYAAAGGSGSGMFEAAKEVTDKNKTKVWGIGVDSDQYNTVDPALKDFVLTSMLKRVDVAVFNVIKSEVDGAFKAGKLTFDLKADGVAYSTTGGFVDSYTKQVDELKQQIIDGKIIVPTKPGG
jgi:basic membrane protein A and related proteins